MAAIRSWLTLVPVSSRYFLRASREQRGDATVVDHGGCPQAVQAGPLLLVRSERPSSSDTGLSASLLLHAPVQGRATSRSVIRFGNWDFVGPKMDRLARLTRVPAVERPKAHDLDLARPWVHL